MSQKDKDPVTQNTIDIEIIKNDINTIKNNHLAHIETSMANLERKLERMDGRVWVIVLGVLGTFVSIAVERLF